MLICRGRAPRAAKAILRFFAWRLSGRLIGRGYASDRSNFRCREGELKIDGLRFGFFFRFHTHRRVRGPDRRNFHTARTSKKISARKRKKDRSLSSTRVIPEISVRLARLELGSGVFSNENRSDRGLGRRARRLADRARAISKHVDGPTPLLSLANAPPSDPRVITGVAARIENASLPSSFREKKCVLAWRDEAKNAEAPNITHGVGAREDGRAARLGEALPAPEVARAP